MSDTRHDCVLFCATAKDELIVCANEEFCAGVGMLAFALLNFPDTATRNIRDELHTIKTAVPGNTLPDTAASIHEILLSHCGPRILRLLFTYLPVYSMQEIDMLQYLRVEHSEAEMASFGTRMAAGEQILYDPDYRQRYEAKAKPGSGVKKWDYWRDILSQTSYVEPMLSGLSNKQVGELQTTAADYIDVVAALSYEVDKLRHDLAELVESFDPAALESRYEWIYNVMQKSSSRYVGTDLPKLGIEPPSKEVFACTTMTALVGKELDHIAKINRTIKRCALCDRHFVPYSKTTRYCHNSNQNHGGKPCSEVGRYIVYQQKVAGHPLHIRRQKSYKAYNRWVNLHKGEDAAIVKEIIDVYNHWCAKSIEAVDALIEGEISLEVCAAAVVLPSVQTRSPSLYAKKIDERAEGGNTVLLETK